MNNLAYFWGRHVGTGTGDNTVHDKGHIYNNIFNYGVTKHVKSSGGSVGKGVNARLTMSLSH